MTILASYVHTLNPIVVDFGLFAVRWYGVSYLMGFLAAGIILYQLGKRGRVLIPPQHAADAILIFIFGAVIGGRIGYMWYKPHMLVEFGPTFPYWGLLEIQKGGMASHGGMLGVLIAAWWISRGFMTESGERIGRSPMLHVADVSCVIALPGLMFGRLANFVNGELLGRIAAEPGQPAPWWAVKFPQELGTPQAPKLTAEQTSQLNALLASVSQPGDTPEIMINRLVHKVQNGSLELTRALEPLLAARHPSQLYQAAAEGLILSAVLWTVWARPRKPGIVTAWFLISYGILRIVIEQFWRLPDANLETQYILGVTRGQLFSIIMVVIGIVMIPVLARRPGPRFSWRTPVDELNASA